MKSIEINSIADLLTSFVPHGVKEIEEQIAKDKINHPVTIGSMYEGLTKKVINESIFEDLGLRVITNSHIKGCPREFDVLLIEGDAEEVAFSGRYICKPEQVIAVIQVKKHLYSSELKDAYNNFKDLIAYYENHGPQKYMLNLLRDGFRTICKKDIAAIANPNYSLQEEAIYYSLKADVQLPVRIVWGYHGFKTEQKFREAFCDNMTQNVSTSVNNRVQYYGPLNFPNLIINGNFTLIKSNGMPYGHALHDDNSWPFYFSSSINPMKHLLEVLWTRLSYRYRLSPKIFGEDLEDIQLNRFLDATYAESKDYGGWQYSTCTPSRVDKPLPSRDWSPVELDEIQYIIVGQLCSEGFVKIDEALSKYVTREKYKTREEFIDKLVSTGLVYVIGNELNLLTDRCQCVIHNDKFYAADNKSGKLTRWLTKESSAAKKNNAPVD